MDGASEMTCGSAGLVDLLLPAMFLVFISKYYAMVLHAIDAFDEP